VEPFLKKTIQTILSKHDDLQQVVIVLPSKRAGVFLQQHLIESIQELQFAPEIFSIESFIEHLSTLRKANQTHQLFSLYEAYKKNIPKEFRDDFTVFMQWGTRLLKDFNDLDAYRINAKDSLENLGEFYQLEHFNLDENEASFSPLFWENLYPIYRDFQSLLLDHDWATLGMLYQDALDALEIYLSHTSKTHYFIGFNALNQAEQNLIQEFLAKNKGEVLWDLDRVFYTDKMHAAGRFIRSYQQDWKYYRQNPQSFEGASFLESKNIQSIGFTGNIEQSQYVNTFLDQYKNIEGTTAVVLGNENLLLPVLSSLPTDLPQWNVTMGYALHQLPLSSFFKSLIDLHATAQKEGIDRKVTLQLLSFPPLKQQLVRHSIELKHVMDVLKENFDPRVATNEIAALIQNEYGSLIFNSVEGNVLLLIDQLMQLIRLFELDFYRQKEHFSHAVMGMFKKVISQLKIQVEAASFPIEITAFASLFQESISLQTLDFSGNPTEGVQIMGMLESRVLDFDHLLITNVNEGVLPVGKNDQSFFPFAMKKQFGLPTFLDNDAIYTYHFYRLLQRAKNIYLLYNSKSEGLSAGEKSRFIRQLNFSHLAQHQFSDLQYNKSIVSLPIIDNTIKKTPMMIAQLQQLALKGFSPTSLGTYLHDPIAFYNRYLLKIREEDVTTKTLSHLQRGTLVHDCLEALYTPFIGQPMQLDFYDKMLDDLPKLMLNYYRKAYPNMPLPKGENHLILKAYERSIQQLLIHERGLVKKGNQIIIRALELPFSTPLCPDLFPFEINIKGKIDRVDEFNGVTRLIDYKTGNVEPSKLVWAHWEDFIGEYKKLPLFQILLYAWSYTAAPEVEVGIISLKKPRAYLLPLNRKDLPKGHNTALVEKDFKNLIEDYLVSLVREIFDEKKSFVSLEQEEV